MGLNVEDVVASLAAAADGIVPAAGVETWNYGWAFADYRRSDKAAFDGKDGPVTFTASALDRWEDAVVRLLGDSRMSGRWDPEEVWGLLASLCETARHLGKRGPAFIDDAVHRMLAAGPSCTLLLIANTIWDAEPMDLGDSVIGDAGGAFLDAVSAASRGRIVPTQEQVETWLQNQVLPRMRRPKRPAPTAIACWTTGQSSLAVEQASRAMQEIVELPLLFEHNLAAFGVYRRGELNRPGVRGLSLDRGAIEAAISGGRFGLELAAQPLTVTEVMRGGDPVHWYSAEPLPLGQLMKQEHLRHAVISCLGSDPIARRVRLASRWFADAHYSDSSDDSALALGVGLDALLNGRTPLPGSAMADRAALLRREPSERKDARREYMQFYGVRSAVAHGGESSKLNGPDFLNSYFRFVTHAAWGLLDLRETFRPASDSNLDEVFDDLRLGATVWPAPRS